MDRLPAKETCWQHEQVIIQWTEMQDDSQEHRHGDPANIAYVLDDLPALQREEHPHGVEQRQHCNRSNLWRKHLRGTEPSSAGQLALEGPQASHRYEL